jgi:hypothetical protein
MPSPSAPLLRFLDLVRELDNDDIRAGSGWPAPSGGTHA